MKKIKNTFYLIGPLALVFFFLFDFIGGMNYPGFDWPNQSPLDIIAWDSYDLIIGFVFSIIAAILAIVAGFLVYSFFKKFKQSKLFVKGVLCVFLAVIVSGLGFNIFHVQNAGTIEYIADLHIQNLEERANITENQNKIFEEQMAGNSNESSEKETESTDVSTTSASDTSASSTSTSSSAQSAIDSSNQKIQDNLNIMVEKLSEPTMIGVLVVMCLSVLLALISCVLMAIAGLKKGGIKAIGIVSIVLGSLIIVGLLHSLFGQSYLGYSGRVLLYMPYVLVAFLSAWIYAYEPAEK